MTNIQGSVQACPPRHARGTHKPLSSAQSRAQECESPHTSTPQLRSVAMSRSNQEDDFALVSRALGGLPIINHVLDRLGLPALLAGVLPAGDARVKLAAAAAIRLVGANLVLGREPLYGLGEWAARYDPGLLGLTEADVSGFNDDRAGRALEALFDAVRGGQPTPVITFGRRVAGGNLTPRPSQIRT